MENSPEATEEAWYNTFCAARGCMLEIALMSRERAAKRSRVEIVDGKETVDLTSPVATEVVDLTSPVDSIHVERTSGSANAPGQSHAGPPQERGQASEASTTTTQQQPQAALPSSQNQQHTSSHQSGQLAPESANQSGWSPVGIPAKPPTTTPTAPRKSSTPIALSSATRAGSMPVKQTKLKQYTTVRKQEADQCQYGLEMFTPNSTPPTTMSRQSSSQGSTSTATGITTPFFTPPSNSQGTMPREIKLSQEQKAFARFMDMDVEDEPTMAYNNLSHNNWSQQYAPATQMVYPQQLQPPIILRGQRASVVPSNGYLRSSMTPAQQPFASQPPQLPSPAQRVNPRLQSMIDKVRSSLHPSKQLQWDAMGAKGQAKILSDTCWKYSSTLNLSERQAWDQLPEEKKLEIAMSYLKEKKRQQMSMSATPQPQPLPPPPPQRMMLGKFAHVPANCVPGHILSAATLIGLMPSNSRTNLPLRSELKCDDPKYESLHPYISKGQGYLRAGDNELMDYFGNPNVLPVNIWHHLIKR